MCKWALKIAVAFRFLHTQRSSNTATLGLLLNTAIYSAQSPCNDVMKNENDTIYITSTIDVYTVFPS